MFRLWIVLCCVLLPFAVSAALYKVVSEDGHVTYTDMPPSSDAKEHALGRINSVGNPEYNMGKVNMRLHYEDKNGTMIVSGQVNGISMSFVVDTGATLVVIPPAIAKEAGLLQGQTEMITIQTANGAVQTPKVSIKTLIVDKVEGRNIAAAIQQISPTDPALGLLGMSFLAQYEMTIDHDKQEILLGKK